MSDLFEIPSDKDRQKFAAHMDQAWAQVRERWSDIDLLRGRILGYFQATPADKKQEVKMEFSFSEIAAIILSLNVVSISLLGKKLGIE